MSLRSVVGLVAAAVTLAAVLGACGTEAPQSAPAAASNPPGRGATADRANAAEWTVLVYMAADNDLEPFALVNLEQIADAATVDRVNVVIQADRGGNAEGGAANLVEWTGAKRLLLEQGDLKQLADLGKVDMSDSRVLEDFITWGVRAYPAERYALVLWDHGGAWYGFATDDSSGKDGTMSVPELARALKTGGTVFDLLGFDACLMANTEVALELQPYARVMVASEEVEPGLGWDYAAILGALKQDPALGPVELGKAVADGYLANIENNAQSQSLYITMSVVDLTQMAALRDAFTVFVNELGKYVDSGASARLERMGQVFGKARYDTPSFGRNGPTDPGLTFDLGLLADRIAEEGEDASIDRGAASLRSALEKAVVYKVAGDGYEKTSLGGITLYLPLQLPQDSAGAAVAAYNQLAQTKATKWPELVGAYSKTVAGVKGEPSVSEPKSDALAVTPGKTTASITGSVTDDTMTAGVVAGVVGVFDQEKVLFSLEELPRTYAKRVDYSYTFDGMGWYLKSGDTAQPVFTVAWQPGQRAVFGLYQQTPKAKGRSAYFIYDEASGNIIGGFESVSGALGALLPRDSSLFQPFLLTPDLETYETEAVQVLGTTLMRAPLPDGPYGITITGFNIAEASAIAGTVVYVENAGPSGLGGQSGGQAGASGLGSHREVFTLGPGESRSFRVPVDRNRVGTFKFRVDTFGDGDAATVFLTTPDGKKDGGVISGASLTNGPVGFAMSTFTPDISGTYVLTFASSNGTRKIDTTWTLSARFGLQPPAPIDLDAEPDKVGLFEQPGLRVARIATPAGDYGGLAVEIDARKTPWLGYSLELPPGSPPATFAVVFPDQSLEDASVFTGLHMGGFRVPQSGTYILLVDNTAGKDPLPFTLWVELYDAAGASPVVSTTPTPAPMPARTPTPTATRVPTMTPTPVPTPTPIVLQVPEWSQTGGQDTFSIGPQTTTTLMVPLDKDATASASLTFQEPGRMYIGSGLRFQVTSPSGVVLIDRAIEAINTPITWVVTQTGDYSIILDNRGTAPSNRNARTLRVTLNVLSK